MDLPRPVMKSGLPTLPGSKNQAAHDPRHGTVDVSRIRPRSGLVLVRIRTYEWKQAESGLYLPPIKDGRRQEMEEGLVSKQEWREATILVCADDVTSVTPGQRVLIPTNVRPEGRAVNNVVLNHRSGEDDLGTFEEFDVFLHGNRRTTCHKCGSTKYRRAQMAVKDERGKSHPGPWNVKCRRCNASWRRESFLALLED